MSRTGPTVPHPAAAYLNIDGGPLRPVATENAVRELYSSPDELWLEVRIPPEDSGGGNARRSLVIEFDRPTEVGARYLRNGYQSWSYAGLSEAGNEIERPGVDMAVMSHFSHLEPPVQDRILAESESLVVFDGLVACTLDGRRAPACFFATERRLLVSFDLTRLSEATAGDGPLDIVAVQTGHRGDQMAILERLLEASALLKGARAAAPLFTGWCSWYQYFSEISEEEFFKNLALAEKELDFLDVFQLDDGYQRAIGDWTETNARFPSGIEGIARRVADAGFIPGIWIAPFVATTEASIYSRHPDWFLKLPNGSPVPAMLNPLWGGNGFAYALDCTNPEVQSWLEVLGRALREAGFGYVKIDFCYAASMHGASAGPAGRAEALRLGVAALRRGLGEEVFLLGCGIPLWPSVGLVDGMRIGPDVAPTLHPQGRIHGLTDALPSLANARRNTVARSCMHRRLWVNDPDCVMLRKTQTDLESTVAEEWGRVVASLGQMFMLSDDLSLYGAGEFALAAELAALARARDLPPGVPSGIPDPLLPESYAIVASAE